MNRNVGWLGGGVFLLHSPAYRLWRHAGLCNEQGRMEFFPARFGTLCGAWFCCKEKPETGIILRQFLVPGIRLQPPHQVLRRPWLLLHQTRLPFPQL